VNMIGEMEAKEKWDEVLLARYIILAHLPDMMADRDYQEVSSGFKRYAHLDYLFGDPYPPTKHSLSR